MASPWIAALRSVALNVPDLEVAEAFYTRAWHLDVAARRDGVLYLRGTGSDAYLLSLHAAAQVQIRAVTMRARSEVAIGQIAAATARAGGRVVSPTALLDDPAGGIGLTLRDPHGRLFEVVHGDQQRPAPTSEKDRPLRLAHAVLNSHDVDGDPALLSRQALGFKLADRTRIMAFMNCNRDHHSLALGDADNDALNHIAFLMPDLESVMRGGGRMKDAGHAIEWGPGRHGPGDNAFNYFIGPFGEVIEYTAEVEQVDDSYRARGPTDWTVAAGPRRPVGHLRAAERAPERGAARGVLHADS